MKTCYYSNDKELRLSKPNQNWEKQLRQQGTIGNSPRDETVIKEFRPWASTPGAVDHRIVHAIPIQPGTIVNKLVWLAEQVD